MHAIQEAFKAKLIYCSVPIIVRDSFCVPEIFPNPGEEPFSTPGLLINH